MKLFNYIFTLLLIMCFGNTVFGQNGQIVNIPDPKLKHILLNYPFKIDRNNDGEIQVSEAEDFGSRFPNFPLNLQDAGIKDLTGIGYFKNITTLECDDNELETIDVSGMTKLSWLTCRRNKNLKSIKLNSNIEMLEFQRCSVKSFDCSPYPKLDAIFCAENGMETLILNKNVHYNFINCKENKLTSLDMSNINTEHLDCHENAITNLDLSNSTDLTYLDCANNKLTSLDVTNNKKLTYLKCHNYWQGNRNKIETLNLEGFNNLIYLSCFNNQIKALDVSDSPKLEYLYCNNNQITYLDVTDNPKLIELECYNNQIPDLVASYNPQLIKLHCSNNQINILDVSNNPELVKLYCAQNKITELDLSNTPELKYFYCYNNQINELNVTQNPYLVELNCNSNNITELDVSNNLELKKLVYDLNNITELNLTNNTKLTKLSCLNNKIKNLDISNNTELEHLSCSYNELESLDLTNNTKLKKLYAGQNPYLFCIQTSTGGKPSGVEWYKDSQALYSADCSTTQKPVVEITVTAPTNTINTDKGTLQLSASVLPTNANNTAVEWSVSNTSIATINDTGLLSAKENGTVTVTATAKDGSGVSGTKSITITGQIPRYTLTVNYDNAKGTVTVTPDKSEYLEGETVSLTISNVTSDYEFSHWGTNTTDTQNPKTITMNSDKNITANFTEKIVYIPDANFKTILLRNSSINTNGDNEIQISEARNYSSRINVWNKDISNLTGIEAFVNITSLSCKGNNLTSLDVSKNTKLSYLNCSKNETLNDLNVSANPELTGINCSNTNLTSLDLSTCTALKTLSCYETKLTSLDVSKNTKLGYLNCSNDNSLTNLNISANPNLTQISCYRTNLTNLDLSSCTALEILNCYETKLTSLNTSKNTALKQLRCFDTPTIQNLELSKNTALEFLFCENTGLNSLDVTKNLQLKKLRCYQNNLTTLDVTKNSLLFGLDCSENNLTALDLTKNPFLTGLNCSDNKITTLNVSKNKLLQGLDCSKNEINVLDVSQNTKLKGLSCYNNELKILDVSNNTELTNLSCSNNQLKVLDISANTKIETLLCRDNQLQNLNIANGNNSNMYKMFAENNPNLKCIKTDTGQAPTGTTVSGKQINWSKDVTANYSNVDCLIQLEVELIGATSKQYDGTTSATLTPANYKLTGIKNSDDVKISTTTGTYDNASLGTNKNVTVNNLSLSGADAGKYELITTSVSKTIGEITKKQLTVSLKVPIKKEYDGTTNATLTTDNYQLIGVVSGENVVLNNPNSGTYDNKNAGTNKTVTVNGLSISGTDIANYELQNTAVNGTVGEITKKQLTVSLKNTIKKEYDGTTSATLTADNYQLVGVVSRENVVLNNPTSGIYDNKNAETNKTVTVNDLSISGTDAKNYELQSTSTNASIGEITKKPLTIALTGTVSKFEDGTTTASVDANNFALTEKQGNDDVSVDFANATATYDNATVGTNKTVTVKALALQGTDAKNYKLQNTSANAVIGEIKAKIILTATLKNISKIYDGNNTATLTASDFVITGKQGNDDVALDLTNIVATYNDKNVGTNKPVTVTGLKLKGNDVSKYELQNVEISGIGTITPKTVTVTPNGNQGKIYGENEPELTYSVSPQLVAGDNFTGKLTRNTGEDVGNYEITQGDLSAGTNYQINFVSGEVFKITKAIIDNISFDDETFEFDGEVKSLKIKGDLPNGVSVTYTDNDQTKVGVYTVTAHIAGANYEDLDLTATLTIERDVLISGETNRAITPNDDGINDFWYVKMLENQPNNKVEIYNRWGQLAFKAEKYDNNHKVFKGFGNVYTNDELPQGTYFYNIIINGKLTKQGSLELRR